MSQIIPIIIPDIGGATDVSVIELLVQPGDVITKDTSLVTLESEKASIEVPSSHAGTVKEIKLKIGDLVSEGSTILTLEVSADPSQTAATVQAEAGASTAQAAPIIAPTPELEPTAAVTASKSATVTGIMYASPSTRRLARTLDIDLTHVTGTGRNGRIMAEDLYRYIKHALQTGGGGRGLPTQPNIDFSKYGEVEEQALSRIKKISGTNLHRNWLLVPHITQFGEADITELEEFRNSQKSSAEKHGVKMTPLVFLMKAVVAALKRFPQFNASLDASMEKLILKKYFHIGVAVDTPSGLVVPVIRNVADKGLFELAKELATVSERARTKGLMPTDMEGSCFTISSLGGIGGTAFTPIVNVPDVAILGVSRAEIKPTYQNGTFVPRLKLPLSLSYDHRVIDGADGARFVQYLSDVLSDIRCLLL